KGKCQHYFIEDVNILDQYDYDFLDFIHEILINIAIPDQQHQTNLKGEKLCRYLNFIDLTPEMVDKFDQLQTNYFSSRSQIYIPKKYDGLLQTTFIDLYTVELDMDNWWDNIRQLLHIDTNVNDNNEDFDIDGLSVADICGSLIFVSNVLQVGYSVIEDMIHDNHILEYLFKNKKYLIKYAINVGNRWMYDRHILSLKQQLFTKFYLTMDSPLNGKMFSHKYQTRHNDKFHIRISQNEICVQFTKDQIVDHYWIQILTDTVADILFLIGCGYSSSKFALYDKLLIKNTKSKRKRLVNVFEFFQRIYNATRVEDEICSTKL
ncbi:unnamed protein product, partial [Didymodactylos carnosus]